MSQSQPSTAAIYSQVDVSAGSAPDADNISKGADSEVLREVLAAQDRTNELLEELVGVMASAHKHRSQELHQWKSANPELADACRQAAEALSKVQIEYLDRLTQEINDNADEMVYGEFVLNEFVDRFGPRLAHLNGVIQVLAQLSSASAAASPEV
jgi:hypothetical protein